MTGTVDNAGRALLRIRLKNPESSSETELEAWIDTGFTGGLVVPEQNLVSLNLAPGLIVDATLGDGSTVSLNSNRCALHWFGEWKTVEVVANKGQFPLLGVALLLERDLHINYRAKTLRVD